MIDDGDQRQRLDRRGDVAQRVQPLVGRRDPRGLADQAARRARRPAAVNRSTGRSTRNPGIDSSLSSVPPVWPSPRPDTIGTATPHAATAGASGIEILSPTPPVECLSILARAMPRQVEDVARAHHRVGPRRELAVVEAAEEDRHQHRGDLVVGDLAVGDAGRRTRGSRRRRAPRRRASCGSAGPGALSSPCAFAVGACR